MQDVSTRSSLSTAEYKVTGYSAVDKDLRVKTSCITILNCCYVCCSGAILLFIIVFVVVAYIRILCVSYIKCNNIPACVLTIVRCKSGFRQEALQVKETSWGSLTGRGCGQPNQ